MAIYVGSARRDENGKYVNGKVGDQDNGLEVSTQLYYMHSKGWYCFRFKLIEYASKMAEAMRQACNNQNIGYDQNERLDIMNSLKKYGSLEKISEPTECDCGTLIRACIYQATGVDVGEFYTGNQASVLAKSGLFDDKISVSSSSVLYDGDILVTKTKGHTVAVISGNPRPTALKKEVKYKMKTLKKNTTGNDVTIFESIMKKMGYYTGKIDTNFGNGCVKACNEFQKDYPECGTNGEPDGSWGPKCWKKAFSLLDS